MPPHPLVSASAGAAFAIGVVATLELASLALPGPRGTVRTWGPVLTTLAGTVIIVIGLPGALTVEAATRRSARRALATAAGYIAVALAAGTGMWMLWRTLVAPGVSPLALTREFLALGAAAMAIWAGARLTERYSAAPLFAFAGVALLAIVVATALVR